MKLDVKFGKEDYQKPMRKHKGKDGKTYWSVSISMDVAGMMRLTEDLLRSGRYKPEDLPFLLEEYAKLWVMKQAGVKTYPMPPKGSKEEKEEERALQKIKDADAFEAGKQAWENRRR